MEVLNYNVIIFIRCLFYGLCFLCYILRILFLSFLYSFYEYMCYLLDEYLCSLEERIMIYILSSSTMLIPVTPHWQVQKDSPCGPRLVVSLCTPESSCCPFSSQPCVLSSLLLFLHICISPCHNFM